MHVRLSDSVQYNDTSTVGIAHVKVDTKLTRMSQKTLYSITR